MKYMLMIYASGEAYGSMTQEEQGAVFGEYITLTQNWFQQGVVVSAEQLVAPASATTVRIRDGKTLTTDGPFAETKEFLAGYYVVEAASLDDALQLAAQIPDARFGGIEVRPVATRPVDN